MNPSTVVAPLSTPPPPQPAETAVLVVDDIEENRLAMRALLARPGLRILTAARGEEALELLLEHEVALALLDVQMPGMDGFELAELMRGTARTRRVPIIFITAMSRDAPRQFRGYEAGAIDFLFKPVDPRILQSKVDAFVEMDEQRRTLAQRNAELTRAIELNETLTAVLAHDLRVPLSAIVTGAEVVARLAPPEQAQMIGVVDRIRRAGNRMARMVADLLDFSRIRSGTLTLQPRAADLAAVLRAVADELPPTRDGVSITIDCTGDPEGDFDGERIAQVLANLLANALEHGADSRVTARVDGRDTEWLEVAVENAGTLPEATAEALFLPFRRRRDPRHRGDGLGLGLYIAQQFVHAHGGSIAGASAEGRTRFTVRLPRRRIDAAMPPNPPVTSPAGIDAPAPPPG